MRYFASFQNCRHCTDTEMWHLSSAREITILRYLIIASFISFAILFSALFFVWMLFPTNRIHLFNLFGFFSFASKRFYRLWTAGARRSRIFMRKVKSKHKLLSDDELYVTTCVCVCMCGRCHVWLLLQHIARRTFVSLPHSSSHRTIPMIYGTLSIACNDNWRFNIVFPSYSEMHLECLLIWWSHKNTIFLNSTNCEKANVHQMTISN